LCSAIDLNSTLSGALFFLFILRRKAARELILLTLLKLKTKTMFNLFQHAKLDKLKST